MDRTTIPEDATTISVFRDGTAFCAVYTESFEDIQESPCGFGDTRIEAIQNLLDSD
ncbi:MAG: hypothetical protein ABFC88_12615 [Thermoguttaceae bacterium]